MSTSNTPEDWPFTTEEQLEEYRALGVDVDEHFALGNTRMMPIDIEVLPELATVEEVTTPEGTTETRLRWTKEGKDWVVANLAGLLAGGCHCGCGCCSEDGV